MAGGHPSIPYFVEFIRTLPMVIDTCSKSKSGINGSNSIFKSWCTTSHLIPGKTLITAKKSMVISIQDIFLRVKVRGMF